MEFKLFGNLSSDGPNINKASLSKLDEHMKDLGYSGLLPLVVYVLHIVHTGFHYGIEQYGSVVENLSLDLYGWFKTAPCKREDFRDLGEELANSSALFYRHLNTRWLTLVPALQKVEERWDTAKKYFLEFLPQQKTFKTTEKNEKYTRISKCLKDEIKILIQIAFYVIDVSAPT